MFLLGLILFPCASLVATVSAEWETPRRPKPLPQRGNGVPHTVRPQRNPYFSNQNINIYPQITGSPPQTKRPHCNNRRSRPSDKTRTSQVFRMDLSLTVVFTEWTPIGFEEFSFSVFPSRRPRCHTSIIHTKHESTRETAEKSLIWKRAAPEVCLTVLTTFLQCLCDRSTSAPSLLPQQKK